MNADIVKMIGNISQALLHVQALVTGLAYLIGLLFVIVALKKLRKIGDARANSGSHEKIFVPLAYFLGGAVFIFLPTALIALSRTAFGPTNILGYTKYDPYNIYNAMKVVIQTAGLIWFVRGSVMLVHSSNPGVQEGPKGLAFIVAGILAMNFQGTIDALNYFMDYLLKLTSWV
ncbi:MULTISPECIES: type IV secretion protein IcmC [Legionella]|uniref:Type IV secretion protein IcmC n=1 Tax=Legionella septentrionalis TaxID=2498109 RepID=A0A3S0X5P7_9GAMM|nr:MULTISPECIES: type IV secretion protein IcmC [Legionella]MCP0914054.1 type IV secretion protein IcmC [Legionella sp. 27cVA30]RUQ90784.1 type IV secretion protein IcmC [Legionella septentrionalis]RUQ95016.1 type IV secretion protein IcmC [Legionella septentrionalis]RUR09192.1 type IV secretion protein IcmC [Legionella septentrionalis]RUR13947.1 type IV secretion protein IcmC [Legionella septentrionalis]